MDRFQSSIDVHASARDCYRQWRQFEEFPRFMTHVRSVSALGDGRYHWVVDGPLGHSLEWDAQIDGDKPGQLISWHTVAHPDVQLQGAVLFEDQGPQACRMTCTIQYETPAGPVGDMIAHVFSNPQRMVDAELRQFKRLMEGALDDIMPDTTLQNAEVQEDAVRFDSPPVTGLAEGAFKRSNQPPQRLGGLLGYDDTASLDADLDWLSLDEDMEEDVLGYVDYEAELADEDDETFYTTVLPELIRDRDWMADEEEMLPMPGLVMEGDVDEDDDSEALSYLGAAGALSEQGWDDLDPAHPDSLYAEDVLVDFYTDSMDVYEEDLENFTEDLDEELDTALGGSPDDAASWRDDEQRASS